MNQKGIAPLVIVAIVVIVAVAGVGIYVATRGEGVPGEGEGIAGATSMQCDVSSTVGGVTSTFTFKAKNIGTPNLMMRMEGTFAGQDSIYIINGAQQKAWTYVAGTWTDLSAQYLKLWDQWNQAFQDLQTGLSGWTGGTWTSPDGTATVSNIQVNLSLPDSLFEH